MNDVIKKLKFIIKLSFLKLGIVIARDMVYLGRKRNPKFLAGDYIRNSSLELVAYEIYKNNIPGNVAEVGVYKGDFAKIINALFPDRKIYLFDTFEGFPQRDKRIDIEKGFSKASQDFSNTTIEEVIRKMPYKKNVIIKKGYFPDTAIGVDDIFCFVSIDVDLYQPTIESLKFFYPRLSRGGYIFVHDFNNVHYRGVREAVIEFSKKYNIPYFPLSDACGSAIFMK